VRCDSLDLPLRLFGGGVADIYPLRGLSRGGPYALPREFEEYGSVLVVPTFIRISSFEGYQEFKNIAEEFLRKLSKEFQRYFRIAMETPEEHEVTINSLYLPNDLRVLYGELKILRDKFVGEYGDRGMQRFVALIFTRSTPEYQKLTPYYISKCVFGDGVASQVVTEVALSNFDASLANVGLGIFAKIGGIPWVLAEPLSADVIVGVGRTIVRYRGRGQAEEYKDYIGSVALVRSDGVISEVRAKVVSEPEELSVWIGSNVRRAVRNFALSKGSKEVRLSIHYSGKKPRSDELDELKKAVEDLKKDGLRVSYNVLHITDDTNVRLLCEESKYYPTSGLYCLTSDREAYLTPLGALKLGTKEYYSFTGVPRTLKVSLIHTSESDTLEELIEGLREAYWGTFMHLAGAQININEPITTKYSRDVAYLVGSVRTSGGILRIDCPTKDVYERPWFL
jgi:hypothetical protein